MSEGEYGELEGVSHRGDFDLRSHMEGKLDEKSNDLALQLGADGKPKWKGSGKDLSYRDDLTNEKYVPHVIEPSAGADGQLWHSFVKPTPKTSNRTKKGRCKPAQS